jgi:hypothetical protein
MAMIMLMGFIVLVAMPSVLWLYALADVLRNDFNYFSTKILWLATLCVFPPLGTILYLFIGRSQRITYYPVGRFVAFCIFILPVLMIIAYLLFALRHLAFIPAPPDTIQI